MHCHWCHALAMICHGASEVVHVIIIIIIILCISVLPFIKNAEENATFAMYFSRQWQDTMFLSLHNFLSVILSTMRILATRVIPVGLATYVSHLGD